MDNQLLNAHESLLAQAQEKGERDGDMDIPKEDDTSVSPYEKSLRYKYQSLVDKMGGNREAALSENSIDKIRSLREEKDSISTDDINAGIAKLDEQEQELLDEEKALYLEEVKSIENDPSLASLKAKTKIAAGEFKSESEKEKRSYTNKKMHSDGWYYTLLVAIGISELAINFKVFQQFRASLPETFVMAISLLGVAAAAHFIGPMIKQWSSNKVSHTIFPFIITMAVLGLFWYIADLRLEDPNLSENSLWIFFLLAVILYILGVMMAYSHVDSSDSFYRAYREDVSWRKKFEAQDLIRTKARKELGEEYKRKVSSVKGDFSEKRLMAKDVINSKSREINNAISNYNDIIAAYRRKEEELNSFFHGTVQEYRIRNLSRRLTNQPTAWENDPEDLALNFIQYETQE